MRGTNNLTRDEARRRSELVDDLQYDVALDLTSGADTFVSDTTIRFGCREPGASTFVDLVAPHVRTVELNGAAIPADRFDGARIRLDGLEAANELHVVADCAYENTGVGLHRFVDPVDGEAYLYSQFESFDAHRVYPCFDQPDLKATFSFAVTAPEGWEVVSNAPALAGGPQWRFATTAIMPAYITAFVAGPYHTVRDRHGEIDLGLFCRRSLARYLDADEIFELTKAGLEFFTKTFDYPYVFGKYDQLFVPEFNAGAMENAGCVTFSERYVFRSKVTAAERERRAETILHEMAHMWFGDLVTMRWWDDLWLNESFASYMSMVALVDATRYRNAWTTFANAWKTWAYRQDQLPSTHPIVADAPDIDTVKVNFDGITYAKGASVLRQLVAWVGEEEFVTGVRSYFRRHEFGNTELGDFLGVLEQSSGRDLQSWSAEWLEKAGVNTLRASFDTSDGLFTSFNLDQEAPTAWPTLRSHRVGIGLYDLEEGSLVRRDRVELDAVGARTAVPALVGMRVPDLVLVNDGDLAYAKIRLDDRSLATLVEHLGRIDDPLARSLCWSAAWDMLRDAELPARRYLRLVLNNATDESEVSVVQSLLRQASAAAVVFGDPRHRDAARGEFARAAEAALRAVEPASDYQLAWARAFVGAAREPDAVALVRALLDGTSSVEGLAVDTDLRWHMVVALASAGLADDALIDAEAQRDPTDEGLRHATTARATRPTEAAKAAAWAAIVDDHALPLATIEATMAGFQQPDQETLLEPYAPRFFAALAAMWQERVPEVALSFAEAMYPVCVPSDDVVAMTDRYLGSEPVAPPIRRLLLEGKDQVERVLRTRARDAADAG